MPTTEEMMAAYALYYSPNENLSEEYAPLTWEVRRLFFDSKEKRTDMGLWLKYVEHARGVRCGKKYETPPTLSPENRESFIVIIGTYVPLSDIKEVLRRVS